MDCLLCGFIVATVVLVIAACLYGLSSKDTQPLKVKDKFWGTGDQEKSESTGKVTIRDFKISVTESELADLKQRLENTRSLQKPLEGIRFEYGMNTDYLKTILEYWKDKYDWKAEEERLNRFPQYIMNIDGLNVHYVHAKPKAEGKKIVPIILIHGWPGSIVEFYGSIPLLIDPRPESDFVFEVICPHIPGYGFSEAPQKPGFNQGQSAKIFIKLMINLGHEQFYAQGGDWGAFIASIMAMMEPRRILGLHVNMLSVYKDTISIARWILGAYCMLFEPPSKYILKSTYPISNFLSCQLQETGYMHIQATKPDTVGVGLTDSPAGLAAYILEKFASWTDLDLKSEKDGGLTSRFRLDDLLTNVMIYWVNNSITSSMRYYKEAFGKESTDLKLGQRQILVPSGFLLCERDPMFNVPSLAYSAFQNIITVDKGDCGHFAALENPKLFTDSVWKFTEAVQKIKHR